MSDLDKLAYTTKSLAAATELGEQYIRDCIHSTGGPGNPPPLKAKRLSGGPGRYRILRKAAEAWLDSHEDA